MGPSVQDSPVRFGLIRTDVNFLRSFYPVIIINIVYVIWFVILGIARKRINSNLIEEEKGLANKFLDNTAGRLLNSADQIWRYQFLATIWACFVQFHNFSYPADSDRNEGLNAAICILALLVTLIWPVMVLLYTRK
jgi:hypothetical protein